MWREQAGLARTLDEFGTQRLFRSMRALARIVLQRDHLLGDELAGTRLQLLHARGEAEIH
jgi:hypothetical protein